MTKKKSNVGLVQSRYYFLWLSFLSLNVYGQDGAKEQCLTQIENHIEQKLQICREALAEARSINSIQDIFQIKHKIASSLLKQNQFLSARDLLVFEENIPTGNIPKTLIFEQQRLLGIIDYRLANYGNAEVKFENNKQIALSLNATDLLAKAYNDLGNVYRELGKYKEVLAIFYQSLELKEKLGRTEQVINTLENIAQLYRLLQDYDKALTFFQRILDYRVEQKDDYGIAHGMEGMANIYRLQGDLVKARDTFSESYQKFRQINATDGQIRTLVYLADVLKDLKNDEAAKKNFLLAKELDRALGDTQFSLTLYLLLGQYYFHKQQYDKAHQELSYGLDLSLKSDSPKKISDFYKYLFLTEVKRGRDDKANEYFFAYEKYYMSLITQNYNKGLDEIKKNFEQIQAEKQLKLMQQSNMMKDEKIEEKNTIIIVFGILILLLLLSFFLLKRKKLMKHQEMNITKPLQNPTLPRDQKNNRSSLEKQEKAYRNILVELLMETILVWEEHTGLTKLDLAEKSNIWRITVDGGRLRTRAMDRYLNIQTLPQKPRWREVLRTAYFVMEQCNLSEAQTRRLKDLAEQIKTIKMTKAVLG